MDSTRDEKVIQALHESCRIWLQSSSSSREAQKAAEALKIMLGKIRKANDISASEVSEDTFRSSVARNNAFEPSTGMLYKISSKIHFILKKPISMD